jgi:NADH:ubiquinone oxidoreductase subunit E
MAALLTEFPRERTAVLPALLRMQQALGYLSNEAIESVAAHVRMTPVEVESIATGYPDLRRTEPKGLLVKVCTGLSCSLEGSKQLLAELERDRLLLGIEVESTPCTFNCATAPMVDIGGRLLGRATRSSIDACIRSELANAVRS